MRLCGATAPLRRRMRSRKMLTGKKLTRKKRFEKRTQFVASPFAATTWNKVIATHCVAMT
jgi:hypothetical protein